jgi:hypothetical protein
MLWVGNDDPQYWRYKRRRSVLRLWRKVKTELWAEHLNNCSANIAELEPLNEGY